MAKVFILSDRAIQIDLHETNPDGFFLDSAIQLAELRMRLLQALQPLGWPAFQCIQADQSLTVLFAKAVLLQHNATAMVEQINSCVAGLIHRITLSVNSAHSSTQSHQIVVNYGGVVGQDLPWLAEQTGMSTEELIQLHSSATYTVQFLGFLPGFAYLAGLPAPLHFPRRENPRARVPAGSLAIGAHYCAVYPWESPGGWHLLGHVEQVLFDPECSDEEGRCVFKAGDTVQFIRADDA